MDKYIELGQMKGEMRKKRFGQFVDSTKEAFRHEVENQKQGFQKVGKGITMIRHELPKVKKGISETYTKGAKEYGKFQNMLTTSAVGRQIGHFGEVDLLRKPKKK